MSSFIKSLEQLFRHNIHSVSGHTYGSCSADPKWRMGCYNAMDSYLHWSSNLLGTDRTLDTNYDWLIPSTFLNVFNKNIQLEID